MNDQKKPLSTSDKTKKTSVQSIKTKSEPVATGANTQTIPTDVITRLMGLLQSNQLEEVVAQVNKLAEDVKSYPDVSAIKGIALFSLGQHEESVSNLKYAVNNSPKPSRWWLVYLGQALNALKKWSESIPVLERVRKDYPGEPMMLVEHCLGEALMYSSKKPTDEAISQAINCFQLAVELDENFPWAQIGLGLAYKFSGNKELAADVFQKAIKLAPIQATLELTKIYIEDKKYDLARSLIQRVVARDLKSIELFDQLGQVEALLGNWLAASNAWNNAQELMQGNDGLSKYAIQKMRADVELACSKRDFDKAASVIAPWASDEKSVDELDEVLERTLDNVSKGETFSIAKWIKKPTLDTLLVARNLNELLPENQLTYKVLAEVSSRLGRWKESRDALSALDSISPLNVELNLKLAQAYEKCEEFDKAFSPYLKAWAVTQRDQELSNLLKIASKEDISSLSDADIELFYKTANKAKSDKKLTDLIYFVSVQLSTAQLKCAGKNIVLLMHGFGIAIEEAESKKDWGKILDWLEALDSVGLMDPLPDWLAIETIWLSVQMEQLKDELSKQQGRNLSEDANLFDPEDALVRLKSFGYWEKVNEFDKNSKLIDQFLIKRQERQSRVKLGITTISQLLAYKGDFVVTPNLLFNPYGYSESYGLNQNYLPSLVHFFRYSNEYKKIPNNPNPYFDCDWYRTNYLANEKHRNPLLHYLENYHKESIWPSELFNCEYVREMQGLKADENPLAYYIEQLFNLGKEFIFKGFSPSPEFDRKFYLEQNSDLLPAINSTNLDPFAHYVLYGFKEGRNAYPWHSYNRFVRHQMLHLEPYNLDSPITLNQIHYLKGPKAEISYISGQRILASQLKVQPLISIVVPVYQVKPAFLKAMIDSVISQTYENWQLCLVDDASKRYRNEIVDMLESYSKLDKRISYKLRNENGHICHTTNDALTLAKGKYVALLDHDDTLTPDALFEVVSAINRQPELDIIYSDEDKVDEWGVYYAPYYKPDWSPHSLWARMYVCHLTVYRKSLVDSVGGFRVGLEGSQDFDLLLRASAKTNNIHHIPKVLYHWRSHSESTAGADEGGAKDYTVEAGRRAISDALAERGIAASVEIASSKRTNVVVKPKIIGSPKVEIIIPSRNGADILSTCLDSVFEKSTYENFRITVVDNGSTEESFFKLVDKWKKLESSRFQVLRDDRPFNFSTINNSAVAQTDGEFLLFLNNDIEVITDDWIEGMLGYAQLEEIGCVGVKLYYPDGTIQHAGTITGLGGIAGHAMKSFPGDDPGYFRNLELVTNYSVVTAACLMISRKKFNAVGGYEEYLQVAFNDVDFCLKVRDSGLYNVYLPFVELYHYESKSRGYEDTPEKQERFEGEILFMRQRWGKSLDKDPFYSPNLTIAAENMAYRYH